MTDDKLRERLLPCPFCGGEAKRFTIEEPGDNFGGDVIACMGKCGASSHVEFGRKENLVSLWNTRAELTRNTAIVDQLASALERLDRNFDLLLRGKPVRDVAETKAETDQALATYRESVKC